MNLLSKIELRLEAWVLFLQETEKNQIMTWYIKQFTIEWQKISVKKLTTLRNNMDVGSINEISREAVYVLIAVSSPILLLSLIVGLAISLLQALTQIQETTLTFVPKILTIYLSMIIIMPYMLSKLKIFTDHIMQLIIKG